VICAETEIAILLLCGRTLHMDHMGCQKDSMRGVQFTAVMPLGLVAAIVVQHAYLGGGRELGWLSHTALSMYSWPTCK